MKTSILFLTLFFAFSFGTRCQTKVYINGNVTGWYTAGFSDVVDAMGYLCRGEQVPGYPFDFGQDTLAPFVGQMSASFGECDSFDLACGKQSYDFVNNVGTGNNYTVDTLSNVFSCAKFVTHKAMVMRESKGAFDFDEPISKYRPSFGANGKENVTFEQTLSCSACFSWIENYTLAEIDLDSDFVSVGNKIDNAHLDCEPGSQFAYNPVVEGILLDLLSKNLTDKHDPESSILLSEYIQKYIVEASNVPLDLHFGVRDNETDLISRIADLRPGVFPFRNDTAAILLFLATQDPNSIQYKALFNPEEFKTIGPLIFNFPMGRRIRLLSGGLFTNARSLKEVAKSIALDGRNAGYNFAKYSSLKYAAQTAFNGTDANTYQYRAYARDGTFKNNNGTYRIAPSDEATSHDGAGSTCLVTADPKNEVAYAIVSPVYNEGTEAHTSAYPIEVLKDVFWKSRCAIRRCKN